MIKGKLFFFQLATAEDFKNKYQISYQVSLQNKTLQKSLSEGWKRMSIYWKQGSIFYDCSYLFIHLFLTDIICSINYSLADFYMSNEKR